MTIDFVREGKTLIVTVRGHFGVSRQAEMKPVLKALADTPADLTTVDLDGVCHVDASALGWLALLRARSSVLNLVNVSGGLAAVMDAAGLERWCRTKIRPEGRSQPPVRLQCG